MEPLQAPTPEIEFLPVYDFIRMQRSQIGRKAVEAREAKKRRREEVLAKANAMRRRISTELVEPEPSNSVACAVPPPAAVNAKVSSVAAQVSQALPGNPIFREYEVHEQVASAGPGLSWKIYSGTKNSTKQAVSIWLFEKKQLERWPKHDKDAFPELLRRGVAQLTRLRHPRLLVVERALEESRDTFAFCTEAIFTSLANIYEQTDFGSGNSNGSALKDFSFLEIEIRHGLFQLSEALVFLHNDAKILHGNICPSSIVINEKGAWKLSSFDFCVLGTPSSNGQISFEVQEWDRRLMSDMNPDLNYAAPELVSGVKCDTYADIFSLGVLSFSLFNDYKPLFSNKSLLDEYKRNVEKLKKLNTAILSRIHETLREDVKACLNYTPELRPDAIQFTRIAYFDDPLMKIFNYLDSLMQMDNSQKMQFFKGLTSVLNKFPKRPLLQKVFPYLSAECSNAELVPFILPNIFLIAESTSNVEFSSVIFPALIPVFAMQRPYQTVMLLLQNIQLFLQKAPDCDVRRHVLPLIYNSLSNENPKIQELCLSIIPTIGKLVDRDAMKSQLLPKLLRLVLDGSVLSIRVQTLICLSKLMPHLEQWMVADQILPALPKINSKEPGVLLAVLGIYKLAFETEKFGISTEQCARSVLPFLVSSCIENTLNIQQFEQFMSLIHIMFEKVEREQRQHLQRLSASQEEQRKMGSNFNDIIQSSASSNLSLNTKSTESTVKLNADLMGLFADNNGSSGLDDKKSANNGDPFDFNTIATATKNLGGGGSAVGKGTLSLEEKKKIAAEQEQFLQSRNNTPTFTNNYSPTVTNKNPTTKNNTSTVDASINRLLDDLLPSKGHTTSSGMSNSAANFDLFGSGKGVGSGDNAFSNFPQPPTNANAVKKRKDNNNSTLNWLGEFDGKSGSGGSSTSLFPTSGGLTMNNNNNQSMPNFSKFQPNFNQAFVNPKKEDSTTDPFMDLLR